MRVVQLVHSAKPPFTDIAASYEEFFAGTGIAIETAYLTGPGSLGFRAADLRGLKRAAIRRVRGLCEGAAFAIAHRYKPVYVAGHVPGLPVLGVHHQAGDYARRHRRRFVRRRADRIALLGVSDGVRDDLRAALPGVEVETLHHAYRPGPLLDRDSARAELGLDGGRWLGCVARLHPVKDHATLLEGLALGPPDWNLALVGAGPLDRELRALADRLGIAARVRFCGDVPGAARLDRAFDCFVLASRAEGFGLVLLEAMAAGIPIIASDAMAEIVGDAGRLFRAGDPAALAAVLGAPLVSNPDRIERFSPAEIRRRFWSLPFLARIVDNAATHGDTATRHR